MKHRKVQPTPPSDDADRTQPYSYQLRQLKTVQVFYLDTPTKSIKNTGCSASFILLNPSLLLKLNICLAHSYFQIQLFTKLRVNLVFQVFLLKPFIGR